ncbi:rab15 effector protein [Scleropages formosus]|uniref:rab15 effector protein n=1 Tax=Scleropages formosus TaxID=113540 RepID=UPI000878B7B6|nr:rab15 effector protein-like [Scleropages formosus]
MGQTEAKPGGEKSQFKDILKKPKDSYAGVIQLFSDSVHRASFRTQEYLTFQDPKQKLQPSAVTLCEIFLMSCISHMEQLRSAEVFTCTATSKEQKILLGVDWVWDIVEEHSKVKVQVAVQVLYLPERQGEDHDDYPWEVYTESMKIAKAESAHRSKVKRIIEFSSTVGKSCYALFLFFGRKDDPGNIYGVISNNFHAAFGRCAEIDRVFIENFFHGSSSFATPAEMMTNILGRRRNAALTMLVKFT